MKTWFRRSGQTAIAFLALATLASAVLAADSSDESDSPTNTYPMPPKREKATLARIAPAHHVPLNPERYTWKLTPAPGQTEGSAVRVFNFLESGHRRAIGKLPVGTEIEITHFRVHGRVNYYRIPWDFASGSMDPSANRYAWIRGANIKAGSSSEKSAE